MDQLGIDEAGRLYAAARALTGALTASDVAAVVFEHVLVELGASSSGFWLVDDDMIRFAGGAGHVDDSPERVGPIPFDSDLPAAQCIRSRQIVAYGSTAERDRRWPSLVGLGSSSSEAVVVLPLVARDAVLGCLHIGYPGQIDPAELELGLLASLAELCAAALERARLYDDERDMREQLQFLADATHILTRSLEPDRVVQALVDIAVPRLADWCSVLVPEGDELRTVALRIAGGDERQMAVVAEQRFPISGDTSVAAAFRAGEPQVVPTLSPQVFEAVGVQVAEVVREKDLLSALVVPIMWAARPIGVLALAVSTPGNQLTHRRRQTAEGLALRAGVALHNARLYQQEHVVAQTLAEALLPATTPHIPGYECAVRYLPAAGDVAGDWFDVLDLGKRFLVGVGDAAGHGIPAAALMAELRNAARGLGAAGHPPDELLDYLGSLADSGDDLFATALYGFLDPAAHELEWATAGHLPPVLAHAGTVRLIDGDESEPVAGAPIASGLPGGRSRNRLHFEPGDVLVLVTDGVVERRGGHIDDGLARVTTLLAASAAETAGAIADRIVRELCGDAQDDCSVLVLKRT